MTAPPSPTLIPFFLHGSTHPTSVILVEASVLPLLNFFSILSTVWPSFISVLGSFPSPKQQAPVPTARETNLPRHWPSRPRSPSNSPPMAAQNCPSFHFVPLSFLRTDSPLPAPFPDPLCRDAFFFDVDSHFVRVLMAQLCAL